MTSHTAKRGEKLYHYYRCHRRVDYGRNSCKQRMARAEKAEQAMWEFVSRAMKDPGRIVAGMDALLEQKRASMHGDPTREAKTWSEKLAEVVQERRGFQRLAAKGHMTDEELNEALLELEETRRTAERELEALRHRHEELEALERDRDAITASWAAAVPDDPGPADSRAKEYALPHAQVGDEANRGRLRNYGTVRYRTVMYFWTFTERIGPVQLVAIGFPLMRSSRAGS
jgi:hypothetical protein